MNTPDADLARRALRYIRSARFLLKSHAMHRLAMLLILAPTLASAHARLTSPVPRNARDDVKDAYGAPCGGPRSTNVHVFAAGSTLQVQWEETINHDGHFEVLFSTANDQGFSFLKDA